MSNSVEDIYNYVKAVKDCLDKAIYREYANAISKNNYEAVKNLENSAGTANEIMRFVEEVMKRDVLTAEGKTYNGLRYFIEKRFGKQDVKKEETIQQDKDIKKTE